MQKNFYTGKRILVTGGAGFIGSLLCAKLAELDADVTIADNLSTGTEANLKRIGLLDRLVRADLCDYTAACSVMKNVEIVFHLAGPIGGRGYIETHVADCCQAMAVNANVMRAAAEAHVDRLQFASSACVYPMHLQEKYGSDYLLREPDAVPGAPADADLSYGWAKLMGELTLQSYHTQYGLRGVSTRYVTAYGPWENDTHAIMALIRRALRHEDPYVIWGSGEQDRDFTYVDDIVSGTLAATEHVTDAGAVNIGTEHRYTMNTVAKLIFEAVGWKPKRIVYDTTKPEGVATRALSTMKAKKAAKWSATVPLTEGIARTVAWYREENPPHVETLV